MQYIIEDGYIRFAHTFSDGSQCFFEIPECDDPQSAIDETISNFETVLSGQNN